MDQTQSVNSLRSSDSGQYDENGVDLSLIRENLRRSPTERVRRADRARRDAQRLREYGRRNREKRS